MTVLSVLAASMSMGTLVLRDVHQPPAPSWWPPAPGWWLVAAALGLAAVLIGAWQLRRRRRRARLVAWIDGELTRAATPALQVAAMSALLRRAARRVDPSADRLEGEAWLAFLDQGDARRPFSRGPGRVLEAGGYRCDTDADEVAAARPLVRERVLAWMRPG